MLDYKNSGLNPVLPCETLGKFSFTLCCPSSPSCMNEYLAVDNGGFLCASRFLQCINCSMAGCFPEKQGWC